LKILALSGDQVRSLSNMKECVERMREAFVLLGRGEVESPVRTRIPISEVRNVLFMPSLIREVNKLSLKIVSVYPDIGGGRPSLSALVALIDGSDGTTKAIMDGAALTSIRTGAVSGLSCRYLARQNSETLGIIGAGGQSFQQVNAVVTELRGIKRVKIFSLEPDRTKTLADKCGAELGVESVICQSADEVAIETDVLVTATTSKRPVFNGDLVREGTHVISMGAYTPDAREVDSHLVSRASIFVDSMDAAMQEAGDILIPIREGVIKREAVRGDLAGLVLGRVGGRSNDAEVTWFKSVGLALEDNAIGWQIFDKAKSEGIGSWVEI
jgi:ornithine cyclodeaminase/alanine dehydrogenase-like protein (mu-crystallin family)